MKAIKRKEKGLISTVELRCPNCNHYKAWRKPKGYFCCKCGKEINQKPKTKILGELFTGWKDRPLLTKK